MNNNFHNRIAELLGLEKSVEYNGELYKSNDPAVLEMWERMGLDIYEQKVCADLHPSWCGLICVKIEMDDFVKSIIYILDHSPETMSRKLEVIKFIRNNYSNNGSAFGLTASKNVVECIMEHYGI